MAGTTVVRHADCAPSSATHSAIHNYNLLNADVETLRAATAGAVVSGSAVYDPASLTTGSGVTATVTATGAVLGDYALASFSLDLQGITVTAYVSAADTVAVRFQNQTGGTLDLASGTLRVRVIKQATSGAVAAAALLAAQINDETNALI